MVWIVVWVVEVELDSAQLHQRQHRNGHGVELDSAQLHHGRCVCGVELDSTQLHHGRYAKVVRVVVGKCRLGADL